MSSASLQPAGSRRRAPALALTTTVVTLAILLGPACADRVVTRVLHRSGCLVCHAPLDSEGVPTGIEDAHPWHPLTCTDCHGGNAHVCDGRLDTSGADPQCDGTWVYDQDLAHPSPGDSPAYLRDLYPAELDDVDPTWLRFVNPSDLRVVASTCGRCHTAEAAAVRRSPHAHAAGDLAAPRLRSGQQPSLAPRFGALAAVDPSGVQPGPCASAAIARFNPLPVLAGSTDPRTAPTLPNLLDQVLAQECVGCHVSDFGRNDAPGTYRSSGCAACHMPYAEDGLTRSRDPWVDRTSPPHAISHRLVAAPPTATCVSCHHDGAGIGLAYQGLRAAAGPTVDPPRAGHLDRPLYGRPADGFVVDEDTANAFDETPPDVHFEAGMDCVDCHVGADVHGDGRLIAAATCVDRVSCEDCHGTVRERARPPGRFDHVTRDPADGALWLETRVSGARLRVPEVVDALTPGHPRYSALAAQAKGVHADGFSHADELACVTCHAGWVPTCYGCHLEVDLGVSGPSNTTGALVAGASTGAALGVHTNDLVLMRDTRGRLAPSMPSERLFMTAHAREAVLGGEVKVTLFSARPRSLAGPDGVLAPSFGQRPIDPHTTRRTSPFMACDRCHRVGDPAEPDNAALLDLTHGFGTDRFLFTACGPEDDASCANPTEHRLDAVIDRAGAPLVFVGHDEPEPARPLTLDEIDRMRAVEVPTDPPWSTPPSPSPATDPRWPQAPPPR